MSRLLLILATIFVALPLFSQRPTKDYHLKHVIRQNNQQFEFTVLDFNQRGVFSYDKNKFYFWLKSQEVHSTQGYSSGQLLHGEFLSFYENKQLASKGSFHKGLKNGEWLYWNSEGQIIHVEYWKAGNLKKDKLVNSDGELIFYKKSNLRSVKTTYKDSIIVVYKNGKVQKTFLDSKGNKISKNEYKNGIIHGKQIAYKSGKKTATYYKNGELVQKKNRKFSLKNLFIKGNKVDKNSKSKSSSSTKNKSK